MYLKEIRLYNFKNHQEISFELKEGIVAFVGLNGVGKTNILDAIWFLCYCRSYFNAFDAGLVREQEAKGSVSGVFVDDLNEISVIGIAENGKKKIFKNNGKPYEKLQNHIGVFSSVMITPFDTNLIFGDSELRRKFIDITASQVYVKYLGALTVYNKNLESRNKLLKYFAETGSYDALLLESFNERLATSGDYIHAVRKEIINKINKDTCYFYQHLTSMAEQISIKYDTCLDDNVMADILTENEKKDLYAGRTTIGVHRDDLVFEINGKTMKKFASQGQAKSFIIALKLAQFKFLTETTGKKPILLLDDIFEKIDRQRAQRLMNLVAADMFGQIFITDTHYERVLDHINMIPDKKEFITFELKDGQEKTT